MERASLWIGLLLAAGVAIGLWWFEHRRRARKQEALTRLVARDRLQLTSLPCGLDADALADLPATPRGDRRYGLRYGVTGPLEVAVEGAARQIECAAFQWWYEDRRRTNQGNGQRTTRYVELTSVVAAVRLPIVVPGAITIGPESVLGRVGLTRGGQQLESSEFNRRFRVDGRDRVLTVQLLGPQLQQRLLEGFVGRTIHLAGPILLLEGDPTHRDGSLPGVIGQLPAVRQDARWLLDAFPDQFWRAAAAGTREG
jgi:hypothetical protein